MALGEILLAFFFLNLSFLFGCWEMDGKEKEKLQLHIGPNGDETVL